jgi:hypothetical protein
MEYLRDLAMEQVHGLQGMLKNKRMVGPDIFICDGLSRSLPVCCR